MQMPRALPEGNQGGGSLSFLSVRVTVCTQLKGRTAENFPKEMNGIKQIVKFLSGN